MDDAGSGDRVTAKAFHAAEGVGAWRVLFWGAYAHWRCASLAEGAQLVADDQVLLTESGGALYARAPAAIAGMIEARGLGLLTLPFRRLARIILAVDLALTQTRLPEPQQRCLHRVTIECLPARPDSAFARALAHYLKGVQDSAHGRV